MRSTIFLIAIFSCLLALCNATYVEVWNSIGVKTYQVQDTQCYTVDPMFTSPVNNYHNNVIVSGYPAQFFSNADCTGLVSMIYQTNPWVNVYNPIRSFKLVMPATK
ncbi:hypothetical protein GGI21_003078 [Coemansia aciculifera]|nr:hypothetical protein GGI21_003078 [Coemansia aciculifera]